MAGSIEVITPGIERFGFCRGVVAAHEFLGQVSDIARDQGIETVYGYHDIVHNTDVRKFHESRGVVFVDDHESIPSGSIAVLSAHGSSPLIGHEIEQQGGLALDAACPLVLHTHIAVRQARLHGDKILYLLQGSPDNTEKLHDEVRGTVGHMDWYIGDDSSAVQSPVPRTYLELTDNPDDTQHLLDNNGRYSIISQTTLDDLAVLAFRETLVNAIMRDQPDAQISRAQAKDVCRAVRERQEGVRILMKQKPDALVVVTDKDSKNGMSYYNLANRITADEGLLTEVYHIERADELPQLKPGSRVAITASASTPDDITADVVRALGVTSDQVSNLVPATGDRPTFRLQNPKPDDLPGIIAAWVSTRV